MTQLTISDFNEIFDIMERSFPDDEYRSRDGQHAVFAESAYRVYGKKENGRLIGFIAVWEYEALTFIEHFAVYPDCRGRGIGAGMLRSLLADKQKTVCLEVEPPSDDVTRRRIAFYERCGFVFNDYDYTQPTMDKGKNPIPLRIMTYGGGVSFAGFKKIKDFLYKNIYKTEAVSDATK